MSTNGHGASLEPKLDENIYLLLASTQTSLSIIPPAHLLGGVAASQALPVLDREPTMVPGTMRKHEAHPSLSLWLTRVQPQPTDTGFSIQFHLKTYAHKQATQPLGLKHFMYLCVCLLIYF